MGFTRISWLLVLGICLGSPWPGASADSVRTQGSLEVWTGTTGSLICDVTGSPSQVVWKKGSETNVLATWVSESGVTLTDQSGKYTASGADYRLNIHDVAPSDTGPYQCAAQYGTNILFNSTVLTVYAEPEDPVIEECSAMSKENQDDNQAGDGGEKEPCRFEVENATSVVNLTCKVLNFYPASAVQITWTVEGNAVPAGQALRNMTDGTVCVNVTISATPNAEPYVCTVTGAAVMGGGSKQMQAYVQQQMPDEETGSTSPEPTDGEGEGDSGGLELWVIIVIAAGGALVIIIPTAIYCCRKKRRAPTTHTDVKYDKKDDKVEEHV